MGVGPEAFTANEFGPVRLPRKTGFKAGVVKVTMLEVAEKTSSTDPEYDGGLGRLPLIVAL
jgi:hypothetical protein